MKKLLLMLSLFVIALSSYSQDLIVTHENDSLNCKITKVTEEHIYFNYEFKGEYRKTLLPKTKVTTFQRNFYEEELMLAGAYGINPSYSPFRATFDIGYGHRTAKISDQIPSDFEDYMKELKSGFHLEASLNYYISEMIGLGLKYAYFNSTNEIENIWIQDIYGNRSYGRMEDDINISFFGPVLSMRFNNYTRKNAFFMDIGLGYLGYRDEAVVIDNFIIEGSTVGISYDFVYDFGITENLALGLKFSIISGSLMQYTITNGRQTETIDLEEGEYENLSRINFSVGIRFLD